jgi:hypothetical protein
MFALQNEKDITIAFKNRRKLKTLFMLNCPFHQNANILKRK